MSQLEGRYRDTSQRQRSETVPKGLEKLAKGLGRDTALYPERTEESRKSLLWTVPFPAFLYKAA